MNRTSKTLRGTWDGKVHHLKPGKHAFPRALADAFKRQNPIMGTGMFGDLDTKYLVGIEEDNDDCSPAEQTKEIQALPSRRLDPKHFTIIPGVNGIYSRADVGTDLPQDTAFVKP